ncbi:DUF397 domain-containing protein [Salinispora arenicola]|uniref:DUF397 domain-containing protein n=1 Tax=Salinispora arenicola TaxID=168697 RepID=UPI0003819ED4|nr:DUF397 domain-containing protein [Salinispora arenicola]NIL58657.1 DUF397 domain-containing protein [Salinispora arenicola]NIL63811.1 DUF397 domain-containing protein [Salinispora arenicola]
MGPRWPPPCSTSRGGRSTPSSSVANDGVVGVRDSKNPNAILEFAPTEWAAFTGGVRDGEFDL